MNGGIQGTTSLTAQQKLDYWMAAQRSLDTMLSQLDDVAPTGERYEPMVEDLRAAATTHLVAAGAAVGIFLLEVHNEQQAGGQQSMPLPTGTRQPEVGRCSRVPSTRQSTMPPAWAPQSVEPARSR